MSSEQMPGSGPVGRRVRIRPGWVPQNPRSTATDPDPERRKLHTTPVQHAAATVAAVFGLVGLLGFLPGITSGIGALEFAGHHSDALLLGVFSVSVVHTVVHLLFAVAGLALATTATAARLYLFGGGAIYLLLALYGALIDQNGAANVIPVNTADNWLHLVLGLGMIGLGLLPGRNPR
jgi:Domain of unknown function (DUF4383)